MAIDIVDLPIKMVIFHSFLYVYQRVLSFLYGFTNNNYKAIIGNHISVGYPWDILVKHGFIYYGYMMMYDFTKNKYAFLLFTWPQGRDDVGLINCSRST